MPRLPGTDSFIAGDPRFEALHPRDRTGSDRGEFVEKLDLPTLGGVFDENRGTWMIPKDQRAQVEAWAAENGIEMMPVPAGMRPLKATDKGKAGNCQIPPAWTNVYVQHDKDAPYLVIGTDAKGNTQRIRTAKRAAERDKIKYARVQALGQQIAGVDATISDQAGEDDTSAAMMLVRKMGLRTGGRDDNDTIGASTLQRQHVSVEGDTVFLSFRGKGGRHVNLPPLEDRELARMLHARMEGKNGDDLMFPDTSRKKMNLWVKKHVGKEFIVMDFRTYLATSEAARLVADSPTPASPHDLHLLKLRVGDYVASLLGNDRKEALRSYIDPGVFPDLGELDEVPDKPTLPAGHDRREALLEAWADGEGVVDRQTLSEGSLNGRVDRVTLQDGTEAVLKYPTHANELRSEYAVGVLANVFGFDDIYTVRTHDGGVLSTYVPGSTGLDQVLERVGKPGHRGLLTDADRVVMDTLGAEHAQLPGGQEIGVMDYLIRNQDRNASNYILAGDGVRPIDHGSAIWGELPPDEDFVESPFADYWVGDPPRVAHEFLRDFALRLEESKREFTDDEWDQINKRWGELRARVRPDG